MPEVINDGEGFSGKEHGPHSSLNLSCEFSEAHAQSRRQVFWSPDGKLIAVANGNRLVIRDAGTLQIEHIFSCAEALDRVQWSACSRFLLCAMYRRSLVQVWSIDDPHWNCRITEGLAGLVHAQWAEGRREVVTFADFALHLTIWSLDDGSGALLQNPKSPSNVSFTREIYPSNSSTLSSSSLPSTSTSFVAVGERESCKDYVSIYVSGSWQCVRRFRVVTNDLQALQWSPDGSVLAARDTAITHQILLYSPEGEVLRKISSYDDALGVKAMRWSPNGLFLAFGSYDQSLRLLALRTVGSETSSASVDKSDARMHEECHVCEWGEVAALFHDPERHTTSRPLVYREVLVSDAEQVDAQNCGYDSTTIGVNWKDRDKHESPGDDNTVFGLSAKETKRAQRRQARPLGVARSKGRETGSVAVKSSSALTSAPGLFLEPSPPTCYRSLSLSSLLSSRVWARSCSSVSTSPSSTIPSIGVGSHLQWSYDSRYVATRNDNMPCAVWIWALPSLSLHALLWQRQPVRSFKWHPCRPVLAIASGTPRIYIWTPKDASVVDLPDHSSSPLSKEIDAEQGKENIHGGDKSAGSMKRGRLPGSRDGSRSSSVLYAASVVASAFAAFPVVSVKWSPGQGEKLLVCGRKKFEVLFTNLQGEQEEGG